MIHSHSSSNNQISVIFRVLIGPHVTHVTNVLQLASKMYVSQIKGEARKLDINSLNKQHQLEEKLSL